VIEWVGHASFVYRNADVNLICDPWLSGTAFNRGWRQISEPRFRPEDFASISHIWFSHQHPDHFYPPDLRRIPPEVRARITILYHHTIDKKVVRFCQSLGFKEQIELRDRRWRELSPDVKVLCGTWFDRDSWLAIRSETSTVLNLNDCVVDSDHLAKQIARAVGPVDVLLTQFSYAEFQGNADDPLRQRASAAEKLRRIAIQVRNLHPRFTIPFASYVYWCHPENFYMNAEMNRVDRVAAFLERELGARAVVLYPGEIWPIGSEHDSIASAERYRIDLEAKLAAGPTEVPAGIPRETLDRAAVAFVDRQARNNSLLAYFPRRSTVVELSDVLRADGRPLRLILDMSGMRETREPADITMHSESLLFCLRAPWGSNALHVNARFTSHGSHDRFFDFFKPTDWADHGYALEPKRIPLLVRAAARRADNVVRRKLARA